MGATGDLARKKLIPAIYQLFVDKKIKKLLLVGVALTDITRTEFLTTMHPFITHLDDEMWDLFQQNILYQKVDVTLQKDFDQLETLVSAEEKARNLSGRRLLYLALASHFFIPATRHAVQAKLIMQKSADDASWHRVVYEKPFGHDAASAHEINETISQCIHEHQIYRVDHYLTKELISNITMLRFANAIFEPLWNAHGIEHVQIILNEQAGLAGRASFYENYGALRDVVQNHMLELLAIVAMEPPQRLHGQQMRIERAQVLKSARVTDVVLAQCQEYRNETGVKKDSKTETFALLRLVVENERWAQVPFYVKTGKYLTKHETAIHIKFRETPYTSFFCAQPAANWLSIRMADKDTLSVQVNIKKPMHSHDLTSVALEFCHSCTFGSQTMRAYETLIDDIIHDESSATVGIAEILESWRIIDEVYKKNVPIFTYEKGTDGPVQARMFEEKYHLKWQS